MGIQKVSSVKRKSSMQKFVRTLVRDIQAMEYMLNNNWFEDDIMRIGAEQEVFLVDKTTMKPAPVNLAILERMGQYDWLKPELAKFNLETNLIPRTFKGDCLSAMEKEGIDYLKKVQTTADAFNVKVALAGILPSLHRNDVEMYNLTPNERYKEILEITKAQLNGHDFSFYIQGVDELRIKQQSALLPACSTSYQVHLQVSPPDFVNYYNIAQALAGPMLAISANSALVFGKRLWHESRMSLYQQSSDTRIPTKFMRQQSPRVNFGEHWLEGSIMDLYREDISRFRVLLGGIVREDALEMISNGDVPTLKALQIHNSTVYRWNRPCYGISSNGKPHLRIENRMLSAGPTVLDEMANTAFWLGLMIGLEHEVTDIRQVMSFADVKENFGKAARYGIHSELNWFKGAKMSAKDLIIEVLLPIARLGLEIRNIDADDINRYLEVIEQRAAKKQNGAIWMVNSYAELTKHISSQEALAVLTGSMIEQQSTNKAVSTWEIAKLETSKQYTFSQLKVEECMRTKLRTVRKDDILELAYEMMKWEKVDVLFVEDKKRKLLGVVTKEQLTTFFDENGQFIPNNKITTIQKIMSKNPLTVSPQNTLEEAVNLMNEHDLTYLPVVMDKGLLVGSITIANCEQLLKDKNNKQIIYSTFPRE